MHQVNIHEAKSQLSKLIEEAVNGEPFVIAKAGKPLVIVKRLDAPVLKKRIGFMKDQFNVPDDFNTMEQKMIENLFGDHE